MMNFEAIMDKIISDLYEKRISNARKARDNCKPDSWGWDFWNYVAIQLQTKLDYERKKYETSGT